MPPTYNDPALALALQVADEANKAHADAMAKAEQTRLGLSAAGTNLGLQAAKYLKVVEPPPPVIDPPPPVIDPPPPPVVVGEPLDTIWKTDASTVAGIKQASSYMHWGTSTWFPGKTQPSELPTDQLKGVWHGFKGFDPQTGQSGTLWFVRAFNVFGTIDGLELWNIGDFDKGREGHGLYLNCCPHLDTTIKNYKTRKIGAQSIQREWRTHETELPPAMWQGGGGVFRVEDCDFQESGLIDDATGGQVVRASWTMSLYNTMQRTEVRRVNHVNYWSPPPHEGTLWIGPGQSNFRTPYALVEDCTFWTKAHDRAEVFFAACDEAILRRTRLDGIGNYVDVSVDCKKFALADMPQDTLVRVKGTGPDLHREPIKTYLVKAGLTLELTFP